MYRFFLAGRYTLGRPVSYLAMVAIGLAVMALIAVSSIMNGFLEETERVLRGSTADIIVSPRGMARFGASREAWEEIVNAHPLVEASASHYVRPGVFKIKGRDLLSVPQLADKFAVKVVGIDVEQELAATDFEAYLTRIEEAYFSSLIAREMAADEAREQVEAVLPVYTVDDTSDPFYLDRKQILRPELRNVKLPRVLMSFSRMHYFGLEKGSAIEIVTIPDTNAPTGDTINTSSTTFIIAGAYDTGYDGVDGATLFIQREDFPAWAGTSAEFNEIVVRCAPGSDLGEVAQDLRQAFSGDAGVETWEDRHATWLGAVRNERNILFVLFGFFLLLVCTITFSVLTMLVQQKVRDIGILSSMGATAGGVATVFTLSGVMIASLGGLMGLGGGMLLNAQMNNVKDWIESTFGVQIFDKAVYAFSEIPVADDFSINVSIALATVVGAVVPCLYPAWRAGRLDPVEALRHD